MNSLKINESKNKEREVWVRSINKFKIQERDFDSIDQAK